MDHTKEGKQLSDGESFILLKAAVDHPVLICTSRRPDVNTVKDRFRAVLTHQLFEVCKKPARASANHHPFQESGRRREVNHLKRHLTTLKKKKALSPLAYLPKEEVARSEAHVSALEQRFYHHPGSNPLIHGPCNSH